MTSLQKFHELQKANFTKPLMVKSAGSDLTDLQAFIGTQTIVENLHFCHANPVF